MVAALARHVFVFDRAAVAPSTEDGQEVAEGRRFSDRAACEVGNYLIEAKRSDSWDAIVGLLLFLDAEQPDFFHRLMRGCRNLSNAGYRDRWTGRLAHGRRAGHVRPGGRPRAAAERRKDM